MEIIRWIQSAMWLIFILPINSNQLLHSKSSLPLELSGYSTSCTKDNYTINLKFGRPFNGIVYAKGFPYSKDQKWDHSCFAVGNHKDYLDLSLRTNRCGVRLIGKNDGEFFYRANLVVQNDKILQQYTNFEVVTSCLLNTSALEMLENHHNTRSGKGIKFNAGDKSISKNAKAWMELLGGNGANEVVVGEPLQVLVKTQLPDNVAACVSNCFAYDGLFERFENLTDSRGCSYDEQLVPTLVRIQNTRKTTAGSKMSQQVSKSIFPAFKFPDTSKLHLKCSISFYKHNCPPINCGDTTSHERVPKSTRDLQIVEKLDVFNSIDVLAPGIEGDLLHTGGEDNNNNNSSNNKICLSSTDIAVHLALLGSVVFILSLVIFIIFWKSSKRKYSKTSSILLPTSRPASISSVYCMRR